jgi:ubiquinone/menaquinone biosynthesis C-methylase UbiE
MGFYQDQILPHLLHLSMRRRHFHAYRNRVISAAEGHVLEIGIGAGLNLPYYSAQAERVIGLDPSPKMLAMARQATSTAVRVELIEGAAESIPLSSGSIDTVVSTWTLCSVPDLLRALGQIREVLKSNGKFIFVEHGRSPHAAVQWWQNKLTPAWSRLSGGCHLNRPIVDSLESAGFTIERLETGYMRGPKAMTYMFEGVARPR